MTTAKRFSSNLLIDIRRLLKDFGNSKKAIPFSFLFSLNLSRGKPQTLHRFPVAHIITCSNGEWPLLCSRDSCMVVVLNRINYRWLFIMVSSSHKTLKISTRVQQIMAPSGAKTTFLCLCRYRD